MINFDAGLIKNKMSLKDLKSLSAQVLQEHEMTRMNFRRFDILNVILGISGLLIFIFLRFKKSRLRIVKKGAEILTGNIWKYENEEERKLAYDRNIFLSNALLMLPLHLASFGLMIFGILEVLQWASDTYFLFYFFIILTFLIFTWGLIDFEFTFENEENSIINFDRIHKADIEYYYYLIQYVCSNVK